MRGYFNNLILWFLFGLFLNLKLSAISCLLNQIMFLDAFCSVKVDQRDAAAQLVLSSHLQLQKEGFLSTWTNSFVGPWDPSQGLHNPGKIDFNSLWLTVKSNIASSLLMQLYMKFTDEKIKLWLFIPGRHSSVVEKAKTAVCHLRGILSRSKYGLGLYSFSCFIACLLFLASSSAHELFHRGWTASTHILTIYTITWFTAFVIYIYSYLLILRGFSHIKLSVLCCGSSCIWTLAGSWGLGRSCSCSISGFEELYWKVTSVLLWNF